MASPQVRFDVSSGEDTDADDVEQYPMGTKFPKTFDPFEDDPVAGAPVDYPAHLPPCAKQTPQVPCEAVSQGKTAHLSPCAEQTVQVPREAVSQGKTTVMIKNIPNDYGRDGLLQLIDDQGFGGMYDYFYLPIDGDRGLNLAYAFINFVDAGNVQAFWNHFNGFKTWHFPSSKQAELSWSKIQGLAANIKSIRKKPLMRSSIQQERKPLLFKDGKRSEWNFQ